MISWVTSRTGSLATGGPKIVLGFLYYSSDLSKSLYLFVDVCWCIGSRIHLWIHFLFRIFDIIYLWFMYHPFIYLFVGHHPYLFTVHTRTDTHRHAHTLAQNCHCEFRCRVHLTCKNNPFKPDRRRSLRGPEKQWKAAIAIASANWRKLEADPFQQSHIAPNLTDCENRTRSAKSKIKLFENGMVGLGLATSHHRILTWKLKQARRSSVPDYHIMS